VHQGCDALHAVRCGLKVGGGTFFFAIGSLARDSGWKPEALDLKPNVAPTPRKKPTKLSKAARDRIEAVIDLTAASSIAGKHIESMDDSARCAVIEMAQKNHRKVENKNVKAAVLEVQYAALCRDTFVKHLQAKVIPTKAMQHTRRPHLLRTKRPLPKSKLVTGSLRLKICLLA
jgi:hypothetical protein